MQIGPSLSLSWTRRVAAAFSPAPGLQLWLDAASSPLWQDAAGTVPAVADGDPVRRWDDLSGNGRHFVAPSDAARPTLKLAVQNGRPVLRGDGVDDQLACGSTAWADMPAQTVFAVLKPSNGGIAEAYSARHGSGDNNLSLPVYSGGGNGWFGAARQLAGGLYHWRYDCPPKTAGWVLLSASVAGTTAPTVRTQGVERAGSYPGAINVAASAATLFRGANGAMAGDLAAVLVYDSVLSPADNEVYLNARWGIY